MKLSCIIIEDEPLAIEKLEGFIKKTELLRLEKSFDNAINGLFYIQNNSIDIVFLDVQMPDLTGIEILETLSNKPYIIITSAYSEYALKGYELNVFDYLLKPFGFNRFLKAVLKVKDDYLLKTAVNETNSHIMIRSEHKFINIAIQDILYLEGMKEYLRIVLPDKKIMTKSNFKNILKDLPQSTFFQVHKSWVVNKNKIECIEKERIQIGNTQIPIGGTYKKVLNMLIPTNK